MPDPNPNPQATPPPAAPPAFDAKTFVNEFATGVNLTAEQRAAIEPILTSPAASTWFGQRESTRSAEIAAANQRAEAEITKVKTDFKTYQTDMAAYIKRQEDKFGAASKQATDARDQLHKATERARATALKYGIDEKEIIGDEPPVDPSKVTPPPAPDPNAPAPYLTRHENQLLARVQLEVNAVVDDLAYEHQQLYGERLTRKEKRIIIDKIMEAAPRYIDKLDDVEPVTRQIWEREFKVGDKRQTLADAKNKQAIEEAYQKGLREGASREASPTPVPGMDRGIPNALSVLKPKGQRESGDKSYLRTAAADFDARMAKHGNSHAAGGAA